MQLKRFRGKELPEVVRQIRQELGPDAVILHARPAKAQGARGLLGGAEVEVLAAVDPSAAPPAADEAPAEPPAIDRGRAPGRPSPPPASTATPAAPVPAVPSPASPPRVHPWRRHGTAAGSRPVEAQLAELRELVIRLGGARMLPPEQIPVYDRLTSAGVEESLAFAILSGLPRTDREGRALEAGDAALAVLDRVTAMVPVAAPGVTSGNPVMVFVGPAGAGKTTTLAKLASRARIAGASLQLVSLDDGGLGAPSPLETFAGILDVPYAYAPTPDDVRRVLERVPDGTTVMVDTPGLEPGDEQGRSDLEALLRAAAPTEVHLVVPATGKPGDVLAAVAATSALGVTALLWTKVDATSTHGTVLSATLESGLPLSYFGSGRDVPDDIRPATARELARLVLGKED